jgi:hypothetical protein
MPSGTFNPEISAAFTKTPEVVYSLIVPDDPFATNRSEPDTAIAFGPFNPEISEAFTVAPAVVYAPIVLPPWFTTNRSEPPTAMPNGEFNPKISEAFSVAPEVVYAPTVLPPWFATKISSARAALLESNASRTANRPHNPRLYNGFIGFPSKLTGIPRNRRPFKSRFPFGPKTQDYTTEHSS